MSVLQRGKYSLPCATSDSNVLKQSDEIQFHTFFFQSMDSTMHFKQFDCGFAMFEVDSDDEATDGWCAFWPFLRNCPN